MELSKEQCLVFLKSFYDACTNNYITEHPTRLSDCYSFECDTCPAGSSGSNACSILSETGNFSIYYKQYIIPLAKKYSEKRLQKEYPELYI